MKTLFMTTVSVLILGATTANAAMITPAADTFVYRDNPATDYGSYTTLQACNDGGSAMSKGKDRFSLIRFDLASESGVFTDASLTLTSADGDIFDYELYGIPDMGTDENFSESITFNTCAYASTSYEGSIDTTNLTLLGTATSTADALTFDGAALTSFLNADTNDIVSFIVYRTSPSGDISSFASSEATSGAPVLNVVPEPASMALLGLGGIGLLIRRRRTGGFLRQ